MECKLRFEEIKVVVSLKGIIDRLDKRNGIIRIIDYKTGLIRPNEVFVKSIESCFGLTHLKCMQLLFYSLMFFKNNKTCKNVHAGLISFRSLCRCSIATIISLLFSLLFISTKLPSKL